MVHRKLQILQEASQQLVDLKAELYRKQEEFKQQKLNDKGLNYVRPKTSEKKNNIWSKKNAGVLERAQKDFERKAEEENVLENSKRRLEAKAKMYEKITQGSEIPEEDGSKIYLVDFQKKVIDQIIDVREKDREMRQKEEEEELRKQEKEILSKADIPPPASKDEEWVDYIDGFGRTRTCLRTDLKDLTERDKKMADMRFTDSSKQNTHPLSSDTPPLYRDTPTLLSEDMRREIQRQKWEEEAQANLNGPVHYSNVQFDEIRNHGTGFFQFSKTEETRQEEMETLGDLRQQTLDERSRRERLKEKRKAMLDARLAKVKQRKQQGAGLTTANEEDAQLKVSDQKVSEKAAVEEPQLLTRDVNINKDRPEREWDRGKDRLFPHQSATTEEKYFEEKREERQSEFAPPSSYFPDTKKSTNLTAKRSHLGGDRKFKSGSSYTVFDQKLAKSSNKRSIFSRDDNKSFEFMPPPFYSDDNNTIQKSKVPSQPDSQMGSFNTAPSPSDSGQKSETTGNQQSNKQIGLCTDTMDIEEFLKRERKEVTKTQQSDDVHLNIGSSVPIGSMQVGDIPLPRQTKSVETAPPSTETLSWNSDSSYNQDVVFSERYDSSAETRNISGGFEHNAMAQFDVYGQPNLYVPPPPPPTAFSVASPVLGSYPQPAATAMADQHATGGSYNVPPPFVQNTDYSNTQQSAGKVYNVSSALVQNTDYSNTQQISAGPASIPVTQNTEETARVLIPKSSIVDTRLIRNESSLQSYDGYSTDGIAEAATAETNRQSSCDIVDQTSNQNVFSKAPVKYSQSKACMETDD